MASFNELIKHYRNQVTNQDPEDYEMSATHAAEELEGIASRYAEQVDADMTMSIVLQAVTHYLDIQDDKFEKRKARNASIAQDAQSNNESVEEEEGGIIISKVWRQSGEKVEEAKSENKISALSESFKQEVADGLKKIL